MKDLIKYLCYLGQLGLSEDPRQRFNGADNIEFRIIPDNGDTPTLFAEFPEYVQNRNELFIDICIPDNDFANRRKVDLGYDAVRQIYEGNANDVFEFVSGHLEKMPAEWAVRAALQERRCLTPSLPSRLRSRRLHEWDTISLHRYRKIQKAFMTVQDRISCSENPNLRKK